MSKRQKIIFVGILLMAIVLIFFRLTRHDMLGDDAHYAFRSIAYFDYMTSEEQTTPVQWFGQRPVWSLLSMHDHPPLLFVIQNIFFKLFGVSVLVARLPSAIFAVLSLIVVFLIGKRIADARVGLIAMSALALNAHFIWTGRVGLLESGFIFFLLLGIYYLIKAVQDGRNYLLWSWFYFGLSFLSKYTFLFVFPGILLYLLWRERWIFRDKKFWYGLILFLVVISPVIIYNVAMYQTRGHFDVQFADLFGQPNTDWPKLGDRVRGSFAPWPLFGTLTEIFSWPYMVLFLLCFAAAIFLARKQMTKLFYLPPIVFVVLFGFFSVVGAAERWLGIFAPFMAVTIAVALAPVFALKSAGKYFVWAIIAVLAGFSFFYALNTNNLERAVAGEAWHSRSRLENYGYNQLDKRLKVLLSDKIPAPIVQEAVRQWWYGKIDKQSVNFPSIGQGKVPFRSLIVFDSNHSWFPFVWMFEKWKLFHRIPVMTVEEFLQVMASENGAAVLNSLGLEGVYLIKSGDVVRENSDFSEIRPDNVFQDFGINELVPEIVYDDRGREAFYIYYRPISGFASE